MTEEQERLYELNSVLLAQKRSGAVWLSDDIRKLANSSLAVVQQFSADHDYVRKLKREPQLGAKYTQPNKTDSKQLLELLDALTHSGARKMGAINLHPLENINSISVIKKLAQEAQKRKLKSETAEEARLRKERAEAAAAQQRVKIKLASDFLNAGNFSGAKRACREAIERAECAGAHYLLFLADNGIKNAAAFRGGKGTYVRNFEEFNEAMQYASDEEAYEYLSDLAARVKSFEEINTLTLFMEYASQYEISDEEQEIVSKIYNNIMRDRYNNIDTAMQYFDAIMQNISPDSDKYLDYNMAFADKLMQKSPSVARKYYAYAYDYCTLSTEEEDAEDEVRYKFFLADSGVPDTAALLNKVGDFKKMDETVFRDGCNEYAVTEICEQCLDSNGAALISAEPLFDYAISKLPKNKTKTAEKYLCGYAERLIENEYFERAAKQNERALALNKDCHEAYFNRVLINKKISNPLGLVNYAADIFDDPDFYAATSAYASLNKDSNLYINIGDALVRADKKLKDSKCRKHVLKNCKLKRSDLTKCDTKINSYITEYEVNEADRKRRETERKNHEREENARREREARAAIAMRRGKKTASRKAFLLALPEIIIGTILIIAFKDPMKIFQFIHFGWLVGITVVSCLTFFIWSCAYYSSGRYVHSLAAKGLRAFLTVAGYIVCFIFMIIVSVYPHTVQVKNARQLQAIGNFNTAVEYHFELTQDIDLSGVKEFKSIPELGAGSTIDGKGHTISNMKITKLRKIKLEESGYYGGTDTTKRYGAGFVALNNGTIKNITFVNCNVRIEKDDNLDVNRVHNGVHVHIDRGYNDKGTISNIKTVGCDVYNYYV